MEIEMPDFSFADDESLTQDEKAEAIVAAIMLSNPGHTFEWYEAVLDRMLWAADHDLDMTDCPVVLPEN